MRYSPVSILNFLANHYPALQALCKSCKTSRIVSQEQLQAFGSNELQQKLVDYKIIRTLQGGGYRLEEHYFDFLTFLVSDYSLDMPAQLEKYKQSLQALFLKLTQTQREEEVRFICERLTDEVASFLSHLEDNTAALEQEVDDLRHAQKEQVNYLQQVQKASYLIDTFLHPLNLILDQHEDSIINIFRPIIQHAHDQLLQSIDSYAASPYSALHTHVRMAEDEVQYHLGKLVDSLLPLLDQIKIGNQLLKGFKLLRDYHAKGEDERYKPFLPPLHEKRGRHSPYKYARELAAESVLEAFANQKPVVIQQTGVEGSPWYFRAAYYQQKLMESLPIDNFFTWCYHTLREEEGIQVDMKKFFKIANLLFEKELSITFSGKHTALKLHDTTLTIPQIHVTLT